MVFIDQLDNFKLLRRKKAANTLFNLEQREGCQNGKGCIPDSEKLNESYISTVTHLKEK